MSFARLEQALALAALTWAPQLLLCGLHKATGPNLTQRKDRKEVWKRDVKAIGGCQGTTDVYLSFRQVWCRIVVTCHPRCLPEFQANLVSYLSTLILFYLVVYFYIYTQPSAFRFLGWVAYSTRIDVFWVSYSSSHSILYHVCQPTALTSPIWRAIPSPLPLGFWGELHILPEEMCSGFQTAHLVNSIVTILIILI